MDELINSDSNTSIINQNGESVSGVREKILPLDLSTENVDFGGVLNNLVQYFNMGEIIDKIRVGTEYVVQVPVKFQDALDAGELTMMQNSSTGVMWPTLMERLEDGRQQIVSPLPIKREEFFLGNPFQELANSSHQLYMQQQMQELARLMGDTLRSVQRIEEGQKSDRIALLNSGREQILLALNQKDEESRKYAMLNGIQSISTARNQFAETLKYRINSFEPVPKSSVVRYLRTMANSSYLDQKDAEYEEIQEYFELYLRATKLLAGAYIIVGDNDNAQLVYSLSSEYAKGLDFTKLKTIEYSHPKGSIEGIYDYAAQYLQTDLLECLDTARTYDYMSISVSGEKLLEVISGERTEKISEAETEQKRSRGDEEGS